MGPVLALTLGIAGWVAPVPVMVPGPPATVTVRVYETAGLSPAVERRALEETGRVLRAASVAVRWRLCTGADRAACDVPLEGTELSLRIVRHGTDRRDATMTLGSAFVAPGRGVLATVYASEVERLAMAARSDAATLLGRATAHEIGHLLMRTAGHARRGVMRETWTEREVRRNRPLDWMFTAEDVVGMHDFWGHEQVYVG